MRDKQRTIESLRRLAERPGTPQEGETARRLLEKMVGSKSTTHARGRIFSHVDFPVLSEVWYAYWCYPNQHGFIASDKIKQTEGKIWMRIKFDHLKQPRWVPVTSLECGSHISRTPWIEADARWLYEMGRPIEPDWDYLMRECIRRAGFYAR